MIFAVSTILLSFGCQKATNSSIVGRWVLTDYLADPGNGSGTWQKADSRNPKYIEFTASGEYIPHDTTGNYNRYEILGDSAIRFTRTIPPTRQETVHYTFSPTKLRLLPLCMEGCGYVYKPAPR